MFILTYLSKTSVASSSVNSVESLTFDVIAHLKRIKCILGIKMPQFQTQTALFVFNNILHIMSLSVSLTEQLTAKFKCLLASKN